MARSGDADSVSAGAPGRQKRLACFLTPPSVSPLRSLFNRMLRALTPSQIQGERWGAQRSGRRGGPAADLEPHRARRSSQDRSSPVFVMDKARTLRACARASPRPGIAPQPERRGGSLAPDPSSRRADPRGVASGRMP